MKLLLQVPWLNLWQSLQHTLDRIIYIYIYIKRAEVLLLKLFFRRKKCFKNLGVNFLTVIYLRVPSDFLEEHI
jgi:hypothetical protein